MVGLSSISTPSCWFTNAVGFLYEGERYEWSPEVDQRNRDTKDFGGQRRLWVNSLGKFSRLMLIFFFLKFATFLKGGFKIVFPRCGLESQTHSWYPQTVVLFILSLVRSCIFASILRRCISWTINGTSCWCVRTPTWFAYSPILSDTSLHTDSTMKWKTKST